MAPGGKVGAGPALLGDVAPYQGRPITWLNPVTLAVEMIERASNKRFGKQSEGGWIGERFDADAGLQYLNAREYDPVLGMFLQPDWFEVTKPGLGTKRYSYSFNDPVNLRDSNTNYVWDVCVGEAFLIGAFVSSLLAVDAAIDMSNGGQLGDSPLGIPIGRGLEALGPGSRHESFLPIPMQESW